MYLQSAIVTAAAIGDAAQMPAVEAGVQAAAAPDWRAADQDGVGSSLHVDMQNPIA
jgi:hypothetical protein